MIKMTSNLNLAKKNKLKVNLFDLDGKRFYVNFTEDFVIDLIQKIKQDYNNISHFSRLNNLKIGSVHGWIYKREFPLLIVKKFIQILHLNHTQILQNVLSVKSGHYPSNGGNLSTPIKPKFPLTPNTEIVRIISHLLGDGTVSIGRNGEINASYYNQDEVLMNSFIEDTNKIFNTGYLKIKFNKTTPFVRLPTPASLLLLYYINDFGSKTSRIPNFIMQGSFEFKSEFLKAFFDDEAYVKFNPPHRYIEMALANKFLINDLKYLLNTFGIKFSKTYYKTQRGFDSYYFYIRGNSNLRTFSEKIGFTHSSKRYKLSQILKFPGRNSHLHGETKQKIVSLLKERQMNSKEMSQLLNRKLCTINHFLRILETDGKIKCTGKSNRYKIYEVI